MHKSLIQASQRLQAGRTRAYISRVAWLDLEKRLELAFNKLKSLQPINNEILPLYLHSHKGLHSMVGGGSDHFPLNNKHSSVNTVNFIQVSTTLRRLDAYQEIENKRELIIESGASLSFSQGIGGIVLVFLYPYKSKVSSAEEKNIIIGYYRCASDIHQSVVEKHLSTFFKYCAATSVHGIQSVPAYVFRKYLQLLDVRYKYRNASKVIAILLGGLVAFIAALAEIYGAFFSGQN